MITFSQQIDVRAQRDAFNDSVDIMVYRRTQQDGVPSHEYAAPVAFCPVTPEAREMVLIPTLTLRNEAAQQLIDELWRAGLRPTEGTGSAGALAAVERHLEDMRSLVFKKST